MRAWATTLLSACILLFAGCGDGEDAQTDPAADTGIGATTTESGASHNEEWKRLPVVPRISADSRHRLRAEVARANRAGMRPRVFAKIGDSNTDYPQNLYGLGCRDVELGPHSALAQTLHRYRTAGLKGLSAYPECSPTNPFSRDSAAAESGVWTEWLLTSVQELENSSYISPPAGCRTGESPLTCELRLISPRYSLILIASNDVLLAMPLGDTLKGHLRELVRTVRKHPSVPVLSTLPPMEPSTGSEADRISEANSIIAEVAEEMSVPVINLWRALTAPRMINDGLDVDGLHLGYPPRPQADVLAASVDLRRSATRFGANRRHVVWLKTLARLDSALGRG